MSIAELRSREDEGGLCLEEFLPDLRFTMGGHPTLGFLALALFQVLTSVASVNLRSY